MHLDWSSLFGRLHPLVVHFPIALLLVAAVLELAGRFTKRPPSPEVFEVLLRFSAVGAVAAALTGWWFARQQDNADGTLLLWHRWLGVGVAVVATAVWVLVRLRPTGAHRGWLLLAAVVLVAVCGHLGGLLVWHEDFFN
jgi:uncharacterized membrane protein